MKLIVASLCALALSHANAATIDKAHIVSLTISKSLGPMLLIKTDGTKNSSTACNTNTTWQFVLPLNDKTDQQMMALLMAAQASQTPMRIDGTGTCTVYSTIETATVVYDGSP